ncbi:MAG: hypothetical protein A4E53_00710 [Pelotomaculum sp. PtaB.Bin104]|nr:MAG: hypothetical protein A4E53_00710 [Pelotomaculum sp. PtaB.Bin104]
MRRLFPLLFLLVIVCMWCQPAHAGYSWEKISMDVNAKIYVSPLYEQDKSLYALVNNNLYLSLDEGITWKKINNMPVRYVQVASDKSLYSLQEENEKQLAVYSFDTSKETWNKKCNVPANTKVFAVLSNNINSNVILAARPFEDNSLWQMYRTYNNGQTWDDVNYNHGGYLFEPTPDGNIVFTRENNFSRGSVSTDNGVTWNELNLSYELDNFFVSPNYSKDYKVFAFYGRKSIYYSTDRGDNWFSAMHGIENNSIFVDMAFSSNYTVDKTLYAADKSGHVYVSKDGGSDWSDLELELSNNATLNNIVVLPNNKIIGGASDGIYIAAYSTLPANSYYQTRTVTTKFRIGVASYKIDMGDWQMDAVPYEDHDRIYVPVRYLAYGLGIQDNDITWDNKTKEVTLSKDGTIVKLNLDSQLLYVNDNAVKMDVLPQMKDSRVMLPARWVAEAFGASVSWNEQEQVVAIKYEEKEEE